MGFNQWEEVETRKYNLDTFHQPCSRCQPSSSYQPLPHPQDFCTCKKQGFRLTPLEFGLAQRLRPLVDTEVIVEFLNGEYTTEIEGTLLLVGTDFIELLVDPIVNKKKRKGRILYIPFHAIKWVERSGFAE